VPGLRPIQHLETVSRDFPGVWKEYPHLIAQLQKLGRWPQSCFCPLAAAQAIVSGGGNNRVPLDRQHEVTRVAALAAWRPTQGIYRFDPTLLDELLHTPFDGTLPAEHLQRLPAWCVYVELDSSEHAGFFAFIDHDLRQNHSSLRLVLDSPAASSPLAQNLSLRLDAGTLEQAIRRLIDHATSLLTHRAIPEKFKSEARELATMQQEPEELQRHVDYIKRLAEPIISVLLYLCAADAEMRPTRDPKRGHEFPRLKRGPDGQVNIPLARRPEVWETGFGLGAALREAQQASREPGRSPRGHIRRAHWHSYWRGSADSKELALRWLPPIPVNLELPDRPTLHRVPHSR